MRRGEGASKMVMVHIDEARRGSFNARIKGLGLGWERHSVFRRVGEMRTEGIGNQRG